MMLSEESGRDNKRDRKMGEWAHDSSGRSPGVVEPHGGAMERQAAASSSVG